MAWHRVDTQPLTIEASVAPARAQAVTAALARRVLPLLVRRDGRVEPLASGVLVWCHGRLAFLTCAHALDGIALGDLVLPLDQAGRLLPLAQAHPRVLTHPQRDLALIALANAVCARLLLKAWPAVALDDWQPREVPTDAVRMFVVAGFPYQQMQRVEGRLVARPVVFFSVGLATAPAAQADLRLRYGRVARRIDGQEVHAPALDGVSGATVWAVQVADAAAGDEVTCVLHPAGVQCAFHPNAYARAEPLGEAQALLQRLRH